MQILFHKLLDHIFCAHEQGIHIPEEKTYERDAMSEDYF